MMTTPAMPTAHAHDQPTPSAPPTTTISSTMALPTPPKTPPSTEPDASTLQIVVAQYNESLDWLSPYNQNSNIYSKGTPPPSPSLYHHHQPLPNIGRETHTYLTYIVNNYSALPPYLLVLQGNIHDTNNGTPAHTDLTLSELIQQTTSLTPGSVLPIGRTHVFSSWTGIDYLPGWIARRGKTLQRTDLTPAQFWTTIFNEPPPKSVRFVQGALFGVTREAVWRRPRAFWEGVLKYFETLDAVNPEEGHYMERFWWGCLDDGVVEREIEEKGMEAKEAGAE